MPHALSTSNTSFRASPIVVGPHLARALPDLDCNRHAMASICPEEAVQRSTLAMDRQK